MHPSDLHFFPLALPFLLGLFFLIGLLIALIQVGILHYAYTKIGVDRRYLFAVLLLSLFGSYVNIPVAHLPGEQVITGRVITYFGMRYIIPMVQEWPGTVIAVNVGGAVVPTLLSLYLLHKLSSVCIRYRRGRDRRGRALLAGYTGARGGHCRASVYSPTGGNRYGMGAATPLCASPSLYRW
jgi:uncharacterized membrane protein